MTEKFTQGKWKANKALGAVFATNKKNIKNTDNAEICSYRIGKEREILEPEAMANLELVATAPELYQALKSAVGEYCGNCSHADKDGTCQNDTCHVLEWIEILEKARGEK